MELTARDIRIIGESRYWHQVSRKLFFLFLAAMIWMAGCMIVVFQLGMVRSSASYTITPRIMDAITAMSKGEEITVVIENGQPYVEDVKIPATEEKKDFSLIFVFISCSPAAAVFIYWCYCTFQAQEAGTKLMNEWIKNRTVIQ
jgi:hypothetical protein